MTGDNRTALGWMFQNWKTKSVPEPLLVHLLACRERLPALHLTWRHIDGHPERNGVSEEELIAREHDPDFRYSRWNAYVDRLCTELAGRFERGGDEGEV